jgi:hypothetical protein
MGTIGAGGPHYYAPVLLCQEKLRMNKDFTDWLG